MNTTVKKITLIAAIVATNLSGLIYGPLYAEARPRHEGTITLVDVGLTEDSNFSATVNEFLFEQDFQGLYDFTTEEIKKSPSNATAFYLRAESRYALQQDLKLVQGDLDKAISLQPQYVDALMARAVVFEIVGDPHSAIQDYSTVLSIQPKYTYALFSRMTVHENLHDLQGLLADYTHWIQVSPLHVGAHKNRALIYKQLGDTASAIADLERASQLLIAESWNENSKEIVALQTKDLKEILEMIAELKKQGSVG